MEILTIMSALEISLRKCQVKLENAMVYMKRVVTNTESIGVE